MTYDAILIVSFGGPESRDDVIPFLENVFRGRNVRRERMLAVANHYYYFNGKSPINQQTRELVGALERELGEHGPKIRVYWGNRNWHPMLADTLRQMQRDGIRRALAFVTSAYSSYSGCRQYREDIARAQEEIEAGSDEGKIPTLSRTERAIRMGHPLEHPQPNPVPEIDKLRVFFNHPGFIEATEDRVREALAEVPADARQNAQIVYTAHSIPVAMANSSDYIPQLEEVRRLVSARLGITNHALAYQSRSGPPTQPWLEPDILEHLREVRKRNLASAVVIAPVGFLSDHMEVVYDLDVEARQLCNALKLPMVRAKTVGIHPRFITMIRELIEERMTPGTERRALGSLGPRPDICADDCCPAGIALSLPRR